jgi:hypothetical protein
MRLRATTDSEGHFDFERVPPGPWTIELAGLPTSYGEGHVALAAVEARGDETSPVEARAYGSRRVSGEVR